MNAEYCIANAKQLAEMYYALEDTDYSRRMGYIYRIGMLESYLRTAFQEIEILKDTLSDLEQLMKVAE
jgi:hypothetical protein